MRPLFFDRDQLDQTVDLESVLRGTALFEDLTDDHIATIASNVSRRTVQRDEMLMQMGEEADSFFIVTRGRFVVTNVNRVVAEISSGELIGEIAFFAGGERIADVKATRAGEVVMIDKATYAKLNAAIPELPNAIIAVLARRVASALNRPPNTQAAKNGRIVGLMASYDGALPDSLVRKIDNELTAKEDWDIVMSNETSLDLSCVSATDLSRWLEERNGGAANTLLLCRNPIANRCWAEAVCENSDQVFLVGENHLADDGPVALSPFEQCVFSTRKNGDVQLVLWRDEKSDRTRHTKNWLKDRHVKLHHQVAIDAADDIERIAGFIQGKVHDIIF